MSNTYAMMEVSQDTYHEIRDILVNSGYHHLIDLDGTIMMRNIALEMTYTPAPSNKNRDIIVTSLQTP